MKFTILLLSFSKACEKICPLSWAEGDEKCFRFIKERVSLKVASKKCRLMKGSVFVPESRREFDQGISFKIKKL